jgi:catechol 2,3-dioxygenase-like lactoylglutathione lyase family enzyme
MTNAPTIFRIVLQVTDIEKATTFYSTLLGAKGRRIHGARHYFDCGGVILALLDPATKTTKARATPDYLYFSVDNLKALHTRARKLGCLIKGTVHGEPGGDIVFRPWGERSFYARDPFGNRLCFVDSKTLFTGR